MTSKLNGQYHKNDEKGQKSNKKVTHVNKYKKHVTTGHIVIQCASGYLTYSHFV